MAKVGPSISFANRSSAPLPTSHPLLRGCSLNSRLSLSILADSWVRIWGTRTGNSRQLRSRKWEAITRG